MDSEEKSAWGRLHHQLETLQRTLDDTNQGLNTISRNLKDLEKIAQQNEKLTSYIFAIQRELLYSTRAKKEKDKLEQMLEEYVKETKKESGDELQEKGSDKADDDRNPDGLRH